MRVGQFSDTFLPVVDGVGRVVSSYAYEMGRCCEACYVITPLQKALYRGDLPFDILDFRSFPVPKMKQYRAGFPRLDLHYLNRIEHARMDIAHTHSPFIAGQEAHRIAKRKGIPLVGTFHSKYYDDFYQILKSRKLSSLGSEFVVEYFEKCDQTWVVSQATAAVLRDYGYHGTIEVVENGTARKQSSPENVQLATRTFALSDDPILLFVGQMNWKKNIRRILESFSLLKARGYRGQLVLAGMGPNADDIKKLADSLHLGPENVIMTGHVQAADLLDGLYERADLLVFPSLYDNAPMVVREAAALDTPSLLIRGSSAAEVVQDGQNGLLAEDTSADVAARLAWALDNLEAVKTIGRAAKATIPRYWDEVIEEVLGRYRELIQTHATT